MKLVRLVSVFVLTIAAAGTALAQTFMTEEELMSTFSGATVSGISNGDGKTEWTQVYQQPKKGKTKGNGTGIFGGDKYNFSWRIKKGKWCERWSTGGQCWDMERLDDKTIRIYKNGEPEKHTWHLE